MSRKFRDKNLNYKSFKEMLMECGHSCQICNKDISETTKDRTEIAVIDHCHNCDTVRGILCSICNLWLGSLEHGRSTPKRFDPFGKAQDYLVQGCNCYWKYEMEE